MKRKIFIFGNGEFADLAQYYFKNDSKYEGIELSGFCVSDEFHKENKFQGLPVVKESDIDKKFPKDQYYAFVALMGISLSTIFAVYTAYSITQVFFITSATFAGASLYGYTTKRDLSGFGHFLIMGLIGIIIASVVNIFLASSAMMFAISIIGVFIFTGLTAWDTQNARNIFLQTREPKYGIQFALRLYLNFINLFQMLLALLGDRE